LREAIATWLSTSRGLAVNADQVLVMKSRQQGLHLAAHLAAHVAGHRAAHRTASGRSGRWAPTVMEEPCDAQAAAVLASERGELIRVPVDADGLRTDRLPEGDAALIHVTPEHQRPLGVRLSRERRDALLAWADRAGALILEEDCEGELRYGDMNIPSLMSLDTSERVILLGGFSVSLGPWLDLAYMVLPRGVAAGAQAMRRLIDDSRSSLEQMALAEFLRGGGYARHLHRVTKAYASRRDTLLTALRRHLGGRSLVWGQQAGLHLAWFPPQDFGSASAIATLARGHGLDAAWAGDDVVLLGFGVPDEQRIETGVRDMAEHLLAGQERPSPVPGMTIGPTELSRALRQ
jgi:GntR family transcriptional regulator/MocR family aminotransferase